MNPLLLPLVAAQGLWVRATTEILPEAAGPVTGSAGTPGRPPMRIAVVGESTAAGCGIDTHDNAFAGSLARELADRTGRPVTWQVVGQNGATARRIRHRLAPRVAGEPDLVVLLAGVNDVLGRRSSAQWRDDLAAVVDGLSERAARVAVPGLPPFEQFPALPWALRRYLAERAAVLDAVSRQVCAQRPQAIWISSATVVPTGPDFFAADGFHPSAAACRVWARAVAERLA